MGAVKADVKELKKLRDRLAKLENSPEVDKFCEDCVKELSARLLSLLKRDHNRHKGGTPVDTGYLRQGWTCGTIERSGDTYTVTVENPVEYASYVDLGHRTPSGGWVKGQFFLELSEQELEAIAPGILERKLTAFLQEVFNG